MKDILLFLQKSKKFLDEFEKRKFVEKQDLLEFLVNVERNNIQKKEKILEEQKNFLEKSEKRQLEKKSTIIFRNS